MFKLTVPLLVLSLFACHSHSDTIDPANTEAPELGLATSCDHEATGLSLPATSGIPTVIDGVTGTVISANFFNSGAIDPPHFDGQEYVSACVSTIDEDGNRTATITTDIGLDNDFQIKAYPEFIVGTKFGNLFETSFRYYNTAGLPPEDKWPVVASGIDDDGASFEFANLEYVSIKREVGLPSFTSTLPEIFVTLDVEETNVVGSERDIMLESWFHDTSKNAALIGHNTATGLPITNTLNNIVGIGHKHYPQLDNTLLEMMVHIAPLSPHDVSQSQNNPGQNQLTEIYSGKDFDGDGIDDHFDVDSHAFLGNNNPDLPSPGIYSSGVDSNSDGIDDADLLPVIIGDFAYSIWYGESVLAPIIIYSRETNSALTNDFDPNTPDMDISTEGEITLPWHGFVDYTLFGVEESLQALNVDWATGTNNPFPAMRSLSAAISGVEFGVEPQINAPADQAYELTINRYLVTVDGSISGLLTLDDTLPDTTAPVPLISTPAINGETKPENFSLGGTLTDTGGSGIDSIQLALRDRESLRWYNFSNNSFSGTIGNGITSATLSNINTNSADWNKSISLNQGSYILAARAIDNQNNVSQWFFRSFEVQIADDQAPTTAVISPASNGELVSYGMLNLSGTANDTGGSGIDSIQLALRDRESLQWYNFSNDSFSGTIGNGITSATLSNINTNSADWNKSISLNQGSYILAARAIDSQNNVSQWIFRSFEVQ